MHFDADEHWQIGNDTDLFSVALHEAGHALGLGHSDRPGAVMYPYYAQTTRLTADDIAAIQSMYAVQDGAPSSPAQAPGPAPADPPPPATPPTPAPAPPAPTPSSPAPAPVPPTTQPLSLTLASAPATTTADSVALTGNVSGGSGVPVVSWRTGQGQSGFATGGTTWAAQVSLAVGANTITITATDAQHTSVSRTFAVTRQPGPADQNVIVQLTYPAATKGITATESSMNLHGTASHGSGIQSVHWSTDRGASGMAAGTTSWETGPITLQPGVNNITVQATGTDGLTGTRTLQVTYASSVRDTTAPSVTITSPRSNVATTSESIVIRGTATDNVGVTAVTWFNSMGASGQVSGMANWETPQIPLIRGYNSIIIRAFDAAGNVGWQLVGVTRQ